MKTNKIIFWVTTTLIFLTQGIMPILTATAPMTKQMMAHLGYPAYFAILLAVFKALGGLALIIPAAPSRLKEWAYAGFTFDFIAAAVSFWVVDGFGSAVIFPVISLAVLMVSYVYYHKIKAAQL